MSDITTVGRAPAAGATQSRHERDEGSTLVLVLLLVVIAGLVVVPLMTYATSVLRLTTAVSERTKDVEASKAGLRVALNDPANVFVECDDGGSLGTIEINDTNVSTTCAELEEIGPLDALGYQVPVGAVATQLGAEVPSTAVGGTMQSDPVPSYPATADWWAAHVPGPPAEPWDAVSGAIWMPELPRWPSTDRTAGSAPYHYDMPFGFNTPSGRECKVFFPGRYEQPVDLNGNHLYYFASGVYYFEQPITVSENADVVVGYGLEDFQSGRPSNEQSACADDLQVATSVVSGPTVMAIDGGGATWVFGGDARLIVDDAAGSPSIRFNQRYTEEDRGGRISIITVNGVANGALVDPHDVPMVNLIPASQELDTYDEDNDLSTAMPITTAEYLPSDETYTDAAREPQVAPTVVAQGRKYESGLLASRGGLSITWNELVGNDAGGSLITGFDITATRTSGPGAPETTVVCDQPGDIVFTVGTGPAGENQHTCLVAELDLGRSFDVSVVAYNAVGSSPAGTDSASTPGTFGGNDGLPDAVTGVTVEETDVDDVARVTWTPGPNPDDVTINGYQVTMERVYAEAPANLAPVTWNSGAVQVEVVGTAPVMTRIPAVDPNGDGPLTVFVDPFSIPAGWFVEVDPNATGNEIELLVTPPATGAPIASADEISFDMSYIVFDATGSFATDTLTIEWLVSHDEDKPDAKSFDAYPVPNEPFVVELPVIDAQGRPITITDLDTSNFPAGPEWTFELNPAPDGTELTITTTATTDTPGTNIRLNYTAEAGGESDTGRIDVYLPVLAAEDRGTCTVAANPWFETELNCEIAGLADLTDPADVGYRARVEAITAIGTTDAARSAAPYPLAFDGGGVAAGPAPERVVDPWVPEPVVDIRAGSGNSTTVRIGGYVSVPMGRIQIDNPNGDTNDTIEIVGGIVAGTYALNDDDVDTVLGFLNDIVLQRRVRIVSRAGETTSTAIVQVNEDGAAYAINSWVVD